MRFLTLPLILFLAAAVKISPVAADGVDDFPLLRESYDPALQRKLESVVASLELVDATRQGRLSLALVDLSRPDEPRMSSINGDAMVYAASLPKIAILLGAFVEIERGRMNLDGVREPLTRMIRNSSNRDATEILNRVGKKNLLDILQSERFRLYDPAVNGGLWVGKEYGPSGAYRRDPLHHLSHGATALQVARFYYLLETGQMFGAELTREMKTILGNPGINHKFVKGLNGFPDAHIFRKSGTWKQFHADSALVEAQGHKYILVALAQSRSGSLWLTRLSRSVHEQMVPTRLAVRTTTD